MGKKKDAITLSGITPEIKDSLEQLALAYNCKFGNNPSISELAREIGKGHILLSDGVVSQAKPHNISRAISQIDSLLWTTLKFNAKQKGLAPIEYLQEILLREFEE